MRFTCEHTCKHICTHSTCRHSYVYAPIFLHTNRSVRIEKGNYAESARDQEAFAARGCASTVFGPHNARDYVYPSNFIRSNKSNFLLYSIHYLYFLLSISTLSMIYYFAVLLLLERRGYCNTSFAYTATETLNFSGIHGTISSQKTCGSSWLLG